MIVVQSPSQIPKFLLRLRKFAKEKFRTYFKKKLLLKDGKILGKFYFFGNDKNKSFVKNN